MVEAGAVTNREAKALWGKVMQSTAMVKRSRAKYCKAKELHCLEPHGIAKEQHRTTQNSKGEAA